MNFICSELAKNPDNKDRLISAPSQFTHVQHMGPEDMSLNRMLKDMSRVYHTLLTSKCNSFSVFSTSHTCN